MRKVSTYDENVRLRDFSSAFSRRAFMDVLNFDDYSKFQWISSQYGLKECRTYTDFLRLIYTQMSKKYRCEYVFKNELIKLLLKEYGTRNSVYFSEFKVGNSIADMAMFNGESKAFEIKTEFDSPKRLEKQIDDYKRLFDKVYLVVPENRMNDYLSSVEPTTGIIVMSNHKGSICLKEIKPAEQNSIFDTDVMLSCLRTSEYTNIVSMLGVDLKNVSGYELFSFCKSIFATAPRCSLKRMFLQEIKKRKNITSKLRRYPMPLRQMILSLNITDNKAQRLIDKLNININYI